MLSNQSHQRRPSIRMSYSQLVQQLQRVSKNRGGGKGRSIKMGELKVRLRQLCDLVPEWIQVKSLEGTSGGGSGSGTEVQVSLEKQHRDRVVYISQTVSYQSVREKLGAVVFKDAATATATATATSATFQTSDTTSIKPNMPISETEEASTIQEESSTATASASLEKQDIKEEKEKEPQSSTSTLESLQPLTISNPRRTRTRKTSKLSLSQRKRRKPSSTTTPVPPPTHSFLALDPSSTGTEQLSSSSPSSKRTMPRLEQRREVFPLDSFPSGEDSDADANAEDSAALSPSSLRVNYNQHLMDADAFGGELITSNTTNPRGLKVMLSKLNAGRRI